VLARASAGLTDFTIRSDTNHLGLIRDWFAPPAVGDAVCRCRHLLRQGAAQRQTVDQDRPGGGADGVLPVPSRCGTNSSCTISPAASSSARWMRSTGRVPRSRRSCAFRRGPRRSRRCSPDGARSWSAAARFAPSARNYALARLAADVGLRINEARMLDLDDVRWELGRFGKLNVRHGKGSRRKGPKPRLVPLINGTSRSLRWFIEPATPTDAPGTFRSTVPPRPTPRLSSPNRLNVRSGFVAGPPPERGATAVRRLIRYAGHDQAQR
jgi:integrase/recombinase XerD